jgi:hypothetical protein
LINTSFFLPGRGDFVIHIIPGQLAPEKYIIPKIKYHDDALYYSENGAKQSIP